MTKQRQIIGKIIRQSTEHLSAQQIFLLAKAQCSSMAIATVYRNLNLMVDAGEIKRISVPGSPDRFDKNITNHAHLICEKCGKMSDIDGFGLKSHLEKGLGFPVLSIELSVHYLCKSCAEEIEEGDL
ncbi:MAG: transcriptional repressor [Oscillospiraceae bacterium]